MSIWKIALALLVISVAAIGCNPTEDANNAAAPANNATVEKKDGDKNVEGTSPDSMSTTEAGKNSEGRVGSATGG